MKNPKISVIIPVHNGEKTLNQCLCSVLDQTYNNYEIIVVDNNSTDNTKKIIEKIAKENAKIKYIFEGCKGRGYARNAGINASEGEIIAMTDSDCVVKPDWLEKISKPITHENEKIVMGYEENILVNYWTKNIQESNKKFSDLHIKNGYIDFLDTKNFAIDSFIMKKHLFDEKLKNLEDLDFAIRIKRKFKIKFEPEIKVGHYHKSNLLSWAKLQTERGYWAYRIYRKNINEKDINQEEMFKSISMKNLLSSPLWLFKKTLTIPFREIPFIIVSETSWRIGLFSGIIRRLFKKDK